jgi:methyl-accepting chemotaxis protein
MSGKLQLVAANQKAAGHFSTQRGHTMNLFAHAATIRFDGGHAVRPQAAARGHLGMFRTNDEEDFMPTLPRSHGRAARGLTSMKGHDHCVRKAESVKAAHTKWLASLEREKGHVSKAQVWTPHALIAGQLATFAHVARQLEAGGYDTATIANRMSGKAVAEFDEADKLLKELDGVLRGEVTAAVADQTDVSNQTLWLFALAVLITVLVVVPTTLMNMLSICRPLADARRMALAIAGGDLSQRIAAEGKDEVADLQRALSDMQQGLGALVAQVRDASGNIATASQEIATGNQDLSHRTEQTASNAQAAVSSLSQITATVQQTASSSQMANQVAALGLGHGHARRRGGAAGGGQHAGDIGVQPQDQRHHRSH